MESQRDIQRTAKGKAKRKLMESQREIQRTAKGIAKGKLMDSLRGSHSEGSPKEFQGEARGKMKDGRKERKGNVRGMPKLGCRIVTEKMKNSQRKAEGDLKDI